MIQRFFSGFAFIAEGRHALRTVPGLVPWLVLPLILDVLLMGLGVYYCSDYIQQLTIQMVTFLLGGQTGTWVNVLHVALYILFWIGFVILCFYVVYLLASVVAAPFYAIVSRKILVAQGVMSATGSTFAGELRMMVRMLWTSLLRVALLLVLSVFLFIGSFVPGLNLATGFFVFVLMAVDASDYAFECLGYSLRQRINFFRRNLAEFAGMGAFVGLTAFIPGLILVIAPFAVVGATALVGRSVLKEKNGKHSPELSS